MRLCVTNFVRAHVCLTPGSAQAPMRHTFRLLFRAAEMLRRHIPFQLLLQKITWFLQEYIAPAASCVASAPVVEYFVPLRCSCAVDGCVTPAAFYAASVPVVVYIVTAPAVSDVALPHVDNTLGPQPVGKYIAPAEPHVAPPPVGKYTAPAESHVTPFASRGESRARWVLRYSSVSRGASRIGCVLHSSIAGRGIPRT